MVLKNQLTGKGIGGGGGQTPGLGKGLFNKRRIWKKMPKREDEDWGANCSAFPIVIL